MANPYANASIAEDHTGQPRVRPVGVWIVAFLLTIPGLVVVPLLIVLVLQFGVAEVLKLFRERGVSGSAFFVMMLVVGLISGIGLWRGSRWGWYLALGCCLEHTYSGLRACLLLWPPTLWHLVLISAFASMAIYLNWGRAREFCSVYHRRRWLVFLTTFLVVAVLYFVATWIEPIVTHWGRRDLPGT